MWGVSHGAIQFMAYEELKTRYNNYKRQPIDTPLVIDHFERSVASMISLEEEHSYKYKTHLFLMNVSYRFGWFFFVYFIIFASFYLTDIG